VTFVVLAQAKQVKRIFETKREFTSELKMAIACSHFKQALASMDTSGVESI